jgi:hypothetical protein
MRSTSASMSRPAIKKVFATSKELITGWLTMGERN